MKKHLLISFAILALVTVAFNGCKKDDTTAPVITLNGPNPDQMVMRTTYAEPGYTANDDEDGDITGRVAVDEEINENLPGDYEIHYSVSDDAGNATDTHREVTVIATPGALAANYSIIDSCSSGADTITWPSYGPEIISVNSASTIKFTRFANYDNNNSIVATVNSDGTVTIALQSAANIGGANETHQFQGSGYVTANGIYITYTDINVTAGGATASCWAFFTRL
jgi:hypothetical protein